MGKLCRFSMLKYTSTHNFSIVQTLILKRAKFSSNFIQNCNFSNLIHKLSFKFIKHFVVFPSSWTPHLNGHARCRHQNSWVRLLVIKNLSIIPPFENESSVPKNFCADIRRANSYVCDVQFDGNTTNTFKAIFTYINCDVSNYVSDSIRPKKNQKRFIDYEPL